MVVTGVGSGMTLKLQSGFSFHLSVLYTASKKERGVEKRNRLAGNRMLNQQKNADDKTESYELHSSIRHLCHTLDAFIFVVDASQSKEEGRITNILRTVSNIGHFALACSNNVNGSFLWKLS